LLLLSIEQTDISSLSAMAESLFRQFKKPQKIDSRNRRFPTDFDAAKIFFWDREDKTIPPIFIREEPLWSKEEDQKLQSIDRLDSAPLDQMSALSPDDSRSILILTLHERART
jgi:hypothetical protein